MTAEEYLKHAEECERLASLAALDTIKRTLLESAEMWRTMAGAGKSKDGAGADLALE